MRSYRIVKTMSERAEFDCQFVQPLEDHLLRHPLAGIFTGELFTRDHMPFRGLVLPDFGEGKMALSPLQVGRLFLAPDGSLISVSRLNEQNDGAPAGFYVSSDNPFIQDGEPVVVVAYRNDNGSAVRLSNLHIRRVLLNPDAPERLCTLALSFMAISAYRLNFREITLFAAGHGPVTTNDPDEMIGYMVWPKFGFDGPIQAVDVQGAPRLHQCSCVQDIVTIDADWWAHHGSGREMSFDLRPHSRSWHILLNYVYDVM